MIQEHVLTLAISGTEESSRAPTCLKKQDEMWTQVHIRPMRRQTLISLSWCFCLCRCTRAHHFANREGTVLVKEVKAGTRFQILEKDLMTHVKCTKIHFNKGRNGISWAVILHGSHHSVYISTCASEEVVLNLKNF